MKRAPRQLQLQVHARANTENSFAGTTALWVRPQFQKNMTEKFLS